MMTEEERLGKEAAERVLARSGKKKEEVEEEKKEQQESFLVEGNPGSHIKHVIAVMSGKGGVGKSYVTASLANCLKNKGFKVGILDADITGPSIPKLFGVKGPAYAVEEGSYPVESKGGIKIMSINLILPDEETPVIWRGPVIAGAVKQFWTDVIWGELDYLLIDMPPGTGDVPLTVFQSFPVEGIVLVTSPQQLVSMIVNKARNMASMMGIRIIGIIENMSYFECKKCGERYEIFGKSDIDKVSGAANIPVLARLPIDPSVAESCDRGEVESLSDDEFEKAVGAIIL